MKEDLAGVRNWRRKSRDWDQLRATVKEAKVHHGLQSQQKKITILQNGPKQKELAFLTCARGTRSDMSRPTCRTIYIPQSLQQLKQRQ
jgi:hypothetical protein